MLLTDSPDGMICIHECLPVMDRRAHSSALLGHSPSIGQGVLPIPSSEERGTVPSTGSSSPHPPGSCLSTERSRARSPAPPSGRPLLCSGSSCSPSASPPHGTVFLAPPDCSAPGPGRQGLEGNQVTGGGMAVHRPPQQEHGGAQGPALPRVGAFPRQT
jgi:hypothetical protein